MLLSRLALPFVLACTSAAAAGCHVYAEPEPVYATTEVTAAPVDIETRPSTVYEGRTVYLYNDHWYYRDGNRWSYYRNEPPVLRQRHYVQEAPPARRNYPTGPAYERGPAPPPPASAPPAVRVQ